MSPPHWGQPCYPYWKLQPFPSPDPPDPPYPALCISSRPSLHILYNLLIHLFTFYFSSLNWRFHESENFCLFVHRGIPSAYQTACFNKYLFINWVLHQLIWQRINDLFMSITITFQGEWTSRIIRVGGAHRSEGALPPCSCHCWFWVLRNNPWVREWNTCPASTQGPRPSLPCLLPGFMPTSQVQMPHTLETMRNNKPPPAPSSEYQSCAHKGGFLVPCRWQGGFRSPCGQRGSPGEWSRKALDSSHPSGKY